MISVAIYSWPEAGKSRILFSNPPTRKGRVRITVKLSYDEGATWPWAHQINPGRSIYSCPALLPDGTLGLLYEWGKSGKNLDGLRLARLSLPDSV